MADETMTTELSVAVTQAARSILGGIKSNAANEKIYRATLMTAVIYAKALNEDIIADVAKTQLAIQAAVERSSSVKNSLLSIQQAVTGTTKDELGISSQYDFDILPRK